MNDYLFALAQLLAPLLLGICGTLLAHALRSRAAKQRDQTAADHAAWDLLYEQFGWAKTEIRELRSRVDDLERHNTDLRRALADLERRHGEALDAHGDLQSYAQALVLWIKDLLRVLDKERDGALILARVPRPLPDLDAVPRVTSDE